MEGLEKEIKLLLQEFEENYSFEGIDAYMTTKHSNLIQKYQVSRRDYYSLYNSMFIGDYNQTD